jgi:hypothetical protein
LEALLSNVREGGLAACGVLADEGLEPVAARVVLGRDDVEKELVDRVGCINTIFLQIHGSANGEFRYATPSLERDRLSRLMEAPPNSHSDALVLGPAGQSDPTVNLSVFRRHPCGASACGSACKSG